MRWLSGFIALFSPAKASPSPLAPTVPVTVPAPAPEPAPVPVTGARGTKGKQSRAWRNRNPGNLRPRSTVPPVDHVAVDTDAGGPFGIYGSERDGWADLAARIIQIWDGGNRTVRGIIAVWAPPSDGNNTNAYISGVASALGVQAGAPIANPRDLNTMSVLSDAIRRHEGLPSDPAWDPDERVAGFRLAGCFLKGER